MEVAWKLFADLAERAGDRAITLECARGDTVGDALETLLEDRNALADRVLETDGSVASDINILRNGSDIQTQGDGLETALEGGDELALFPPVSGG